MKTITVSKDTREKIRELAEEKESVNDVISRLLKDAKGQGIDKSSRRTTIHISEDNLNKLKEMKSYPNEPVSKVVARLISEKGISE